MQRLVVLAMGLIVIGARPAASQPSRVLVWDFEQDRVGQAPTYFSFAKTGHGRDGRWVIQAEPGVPVGNHVLAQIDPDETDQRFLVGVIRDVRLHNVRVSVDCEPVAGRVDQACGLVVRYRDANNYYVARANALEANVRLYRVVRGHREQLASWDGRVTDGVWHVLGVEANGDRIAVSWDGQRILDVRDQTFDEAGGVGVWTKADSVTYFDRVRVESSELEAGAGR